MGRIARITLIVAGLLAAGATTLFTVIVVGVRTRNPAFIDAFTGFQRDVLNPQALKVAGTSESPFGVIEHVGRRSGRRFETPVGVTRDGEDWVVPVVYGSSSGWVQNLLAAGSGILRIDGERRRIDGATLVPLVTTPLATTEARAMSLFGVTEAMRLHDGGLAD